MTATERLRALLDERGVEYELYARSCGASVWWRDSSGTMWRAHDNEEDELLSFYAYNSVTPEQAIAATLGLGTCHDKGNIERFICSECGCRLDLQDEDWEATMWLDDGAATVPRFCPNCGKRVVEVDE